MKSIDRIKIKILKEINDIKRFDKDKLIGFLCDSDFFSAPASSKYHLSRRGGLAEHSWNVFQLLKEKNKRYKLGLSEDTVRICGLLHDLCKVDTYKQHRKEVAVNGIITVSLEYKTEDSFPVGHGDKSVIMLQRYLYLDAKEVCMIRWHMGRFAYSWNEKSYYNAVKLHPEIVALFAADYEATTFLEVQDVKN